MQDLEIILKRVIPRSAKKGLSPKARQDLAQLGDADTLAELCKVAENPRRKQGLRSAACWALGRVGDSRAVPILLNLIRSSSPILAWESAKSLILLGTNNNSRRQLIEILTTGSHSHNRSAAAYVLGLAGTKQCISSLVRVLKESDNPSVRSHAAEALGNLKATRAMNSLLAALKDIAPGVRLSAIGALAELGDERAVPELERLVAANRTRLRQADPMTTHAKKAIALIRRKSANQVK